jgi:CubicO group peptidase (beta-lactamase class C family)
MKNPRLTTKLLKSLFFALIFVPGLQVMAQQPDSTGKSEQVNKLFECTVTNPCPGASVIVIHHGKIVLNKGYGFANIKDKQPNTPVTVFRLGSITKQFTAMAIMQLYDKQRLSLDDHADKYFNGTQNGNKVTIRNLLTHTSGVKESLDADLSFTPGTQISYSNTGYNLLGKIIEKVSGMPYEKYLQANIFKPLGMNSTGFEHPDIKIANMSTPYLSDEKGSYSDMGKSDVSGAFAAGALYSTAEDMFKWDQALYTEKLVKSSSLNETFSQASLNDGSEIKYGFGWMVDQSGKVKEVGHGGDITGFNSYIARYPDEQFTVIVLSNIEMRPAGPVPDAGTLAHKIAEIYLKDKFSAVKEHIAITIDPKTLDSYVGDYKWLNASQGFIDVSGESFSIYKKDGHLFGKSKVGDLEINAEGDNQFYTKDNSTFRFVRTNNKVTSLVMDAMGLGVMMLNADKIK